MARRRGLSIACLLLPALLVLLALPAPRAQAGDGWWGGLDEGEAVSLADVLRGPRDYRGKTLTFFCIFHRKESYFDPVRTPFNPERYDNFSVWPDGAALWQEKAYVNDMPFLYIRRNHTQRDAIMRLDPVTRIEVTGSIREMLRGRPTIEVFSFRKTGHRVSRQVMRDINAANNYARLGTENGYQLAARRFKSALTPDLPPLYEIAVRKMLAQALRKLGHADEAAAYERGETYGTPDLAEPDPRAVAPRGDLPAPIAEPGTFPTPRGRGDDLPGTPAGDLPGAPLPPAGRDAPNPLTSSDLPGAPINPLTPDSDLPGTPGTASPTPAAPPRPSGAELPPAASRPRGEVPRGNGLRNRSLPDDGPGAAPSGDFPPPARLPLEIPPAKPFQPAMPVAQPRTPQPVRKGPVSGIPPKRTPRISGVR